MHTSSLHKVAVVGLLFAFVVLGVAASLPHSHAGHAGEKPHACVLCRAQTAQPYVEPPASIVPLFRWLPGVLLPAAGPCLALGVMALPESRAPPVVA